MKVIIAGQGAWGKALYSVISQNTSDVSFWDRKSVISGFDTLVLAVPTEAIRHVLSYVDKSQRIYIVNSTKGIEQSSHALPFEVVKNVSATFAKEYFSILGPGFADEVISKFPTRVNLAGTNKHKAKDIAALFQTEYFRVKITESLEAIELAAAFKNIYAIVAGVAHGLGFGLNTRSQLITIALEEFYTLSKKLGYKIDSDAMPAIIGDLILTCNSPQSRNFRFGSFLVTHSAKEALAQIGATVEGYNTVISLPHFLEKAHVELPLAHFVSQISRSENHKGIKEKFLEVIKKI
jgi:glycerol-3-phosphate dehydrogenase (NAD(P)+)